MSEKGKKNWRTLSLSIRINWLSANVGLNQIFAYFPLLLASALLDPLNLRESDTFLSLYTFLSRLLAFEKEEKI